MAFFTPEKFRFFLVEKTPSRPVLLIVMGWFLAGVTLLFGSVLPIDVNPAVDVVTTEWVLGLMLAIGAAAVSFSALHWKKESTSWRLELIGFPILGAAWLLYTALVVITSWTSLFPIALGLGFAAACAQRFIEVSKHIRRTRRNLSAFEAHLREGEGDGA